MQHPLGHTGKLTFLGLHHPEHYNARALHHAARCSGALCDLLESRHGEPHSHKHLRGSPEHVKVTLARICPEVAPLISQFIYRHPIVCHSFLRLYASPHDFEILCDETKASAHDIEMALERTAKSLSKPLSRRKTDLNSGVDKLMQSIKLVVDPDKGHALVSEILSKHPDHASEVSAAWNARVKVMRTAAQAQAEVTGTQLVRQFSSGQRSGKIQALKSKFAGQQARVRKLDTYVGESQGWIDWFAGGAYSAGNLVKNTVTGTVGAVKGAVGLAKDTVVGGLTLARDGVVSAAETTSLIVDATIGSTPIYGTVVGSGLKLVAGAAILGATALGVAGAYNATQAGIKTAMDGGDFMTNWNTQSQANQLTGVVNKGMTGIQSGLLTAGRGVRDGVAKTWDLAATGANGLDTRIRAAAGTVDRLAQGIQDFSDSWTLGTTSKAKASAFEARLLAEATDLRIKYHDRADVKAQLQNDLWAYEKAMSDVRTQGSLAKSTAALAQVSEATKATIADVKRVLSGGGVGTWLASFAWDDKVTLTLAQANAVLILTTTLQATTSPEMKTKYEDLIKKILKGDATNTDFASIDSAKVIAALDQPTSAAK